MVIAVFGLPGTGKSFFAKKLASVLEAVYYSTDLIRERLQKKGKYSSQDKARVYDELIHLVKESIKNQQHVIVDGTFSKNNHRQQLMKAAKEEHADIFWFKTIADDHTIRERVNRQREHSEADYTVYQKVKAEFENADFPHLLLDSSRLTLEDMVQRAKQYIFSANDGAGNTASN